MKIPKENPVPEYKAKHSAKQVPAWRYNGKAVAKPREIMRERDAG